MANVQMADNIFGGILAIMLGSLFLFFGVKIFKSAVGVAGFGAFGFGTYILVGQAYSSVGYVPTGKDLPRLGISLAAGILGGFVSVWLWKVALVSLGVLGGLGLAIYTMSWKSNGLISQPMPRSILLSVFGFLGAIASLFLENIVIIISTSIVGAIGLFSGIDIFAKTGFNDAIFTLMKNKGHFHLNNKSYGMLAACGGSAAIGGLVQYLIHKKKNSNKTIA